MKTKKKLKKEKKETCASVHFQFEEIKVSTE